jgi:hypothetical protein
MISLGAHLARRGVMAKIAIGIVLFTVLIASIVGLAFAARASVSPTSGHHAAPVHDVPLVASSALVWGGGFLLAFSVAASALIRDRADGIVDLFITRTTSIRGYIVARIGGLAALLAVVLGGGILLSGAVAIVAASKAHTAARTMQSTFAGFAYVLAFALVLSPIAFAALGARRRISGYFVFLAILIFPEMLASMLSGPVPSEVTELLALPSALASLRASLAPHTADGFRLIRSVVALAIWAGVALFFVRRDVLLLASEQAQEPPR